MEVETCETGKKYKFGQYFYRHIPIYHETGYLKLKSNIQVQFHKVFKSFSQKWLFWISILYFKYTLLYR